MEILWRDVESQLNLNQSVDVKGRIMWSANERDELHLFCILPFTLFLFSLILFYS